MKNLTLTLLCVLAGLWACKKDPTQPIYGNYSNLAIGNYWLYDQYELDTNGVYTAINRTDSNYVEKDTLIHGETYFKLMVENSEGPQNVYTPNYLRDSLHYIVNWQGRILFSSENVTDILHTNYLWTDHTQLDTLVFISGRMQPGEHVLQVPAGSFTTKNYRETYQIWPKYAQGGALRFLEHHYAKDVGAVEETFGFYISDKSGKYFVRRLKAYGKN